MPALDGDQGRIELPVAIVADRDGDARIVEIRIYYGAWPLTGTNTRDRSPPLQPDPDLHPPDVVGEYQRALAAATSKPPRQPSSPTPTSARPAGGPYVHRSRDELAALYELFFFRTEAASRLEHCAVTDDGRSCALEYNLVRVGPEQFELPPEAGIAVYVRGATGKLAAARIYHHADPPLGPGSGA